MGYCTMAFAIGQAAAAYGFSAIHARVADPYPLLFALASAALLAALAVDFAAAGFTTPRRAVRG